MHNQHPLGRCLGRGESGTPAISPRTRLARHVLTVAIAAAPLSAQNSAVSGDSALASLVARATSANPMVLAASARVDAAQARVGPAGARPDPMLMAGVQNFPVSEPGFADFMTMKMVGVSQTLPYPGKLALRTRAAQREADAAISRLEEARRQVAREVRDAYFDLAFATQALDVAARSQVLLTQVATVAEAHYAAGTGTQADVLRVRVESARLAEEATMLAEERRAALAWLNATLDWPGDTPVAEAVIPERVRRAAVGDTAAAVRFVSATLGARAAGSPFPPLDSLQALAVRRNLALRAHEAMIDAQTARSELARKETRPDVDVAVEYGQRSGFPDMITATVSVPLPLQRGRKQREMAAEARSELAALHAEHRAEVNRLHAEVARLHGALERDRTQLVLYTRAILPQARGALTSASVAYQAGRGGFATLIEQQTSLYSLDTQYLRILISFAKTLAELEQLVGAEVVS